jgi:hypothetical protein
MTATDFGLKIASNAAQFFSIRFLSLPLIPTYQQAGFPSPLEGQGEWVREPRRIMKFISCLY